MGPEEMEREIVALRYEVGRAVKALALERKHHEQTEAARRRLARRLGAAVAGETFESGFLTGLRHAAQCAQKMLAAGMSPFGALEKLGQVSEAVLVKHAEDAAEAR